MYDMDDRLLNAVKKADEGTALAVQARTSAVATATAVGSTLGLATLAITEQAGARLIARGVPNEFIAIATDRLASLNAAWESIEAMHPRDKRAVKQQVLISG